MPGIAVAQVFSESTIPGLAAVRNRIPSHQPLTITDSTGWTTFNYDSVRKRLSSVNTRLGGRDYTIGYTYFPDGKLQSMTTPGGTTQYGYDRAGRMVLISPPQVASTVWIYDKADRLLSETTGPASTHYTRSFSQLGFRPFQFSGGPLRVLCLMSTVVSR